VLRPLVACLAIASSIEANASAGTDTQTTAPAVSFGAPPNQPTSIFLVQNCNDAGQGSLREAVNAANATGMDSTIKFDTGAMLGCSTITLSTGEIGVSLDNLTIQGPAPETVTVDGGYAQAHLNRIFQHTGTGVLSLDHIELKDASYHVASKAAGGCIKSAGSVFASYSKMNGCVAFSQADRALGGAIYAIGTVSLFRSVISGSATYAPAGRAAGGAVYSEQDMFVQYSTLSANAAMSGGATITEGGASYVFGKTYLISSTVDHNAADIGSGLFIDSAGYVYSSTISTNQANQHSAIFCKLSNSLTVSNSTIALNTAAANVDSAGITFLGAYAGASFDLTSSIVAKNVAGGVQNIASDIYLAANAGELTGSDNLVMASNAHPAGVILSSADPELGDLSFNGGPTRTHELHMSSPAIANGSSSALLPYDQRSRGYPRTTGANQTTDIGAVQFDTIFYSDFESP
jgi:hypothetical protein